MPSVRDHRPTVWWWRRHLNRANAGLACCAVALVLACLAAAANADLVAFQTARPCAPQEMTTDDCYVWLSGRVDSMGVGKVEDTTGPGRVDVSLTLDLSIGQRTVQVARTFLPPGSLRVGDPIEAKLWRGQVTDVRLAGVTVGAVSRPTTRFLLLVEVASGVFLIGLLLLVGYFIDARAGYV